MKRTVTLSLERFERESLDNHASRYALSSEEFVGWAAGWLVRNGQGRMARRMPHFADRSAPSADGLELELDLDAAVWEALGDESSREGVSLDRLLGHALLHLVADLDSGRVAVEIARHDP